MDNNLRARQTRPERSRPVRRAEADPKDEAGGRRSQWTAYPGPVASNDRIARDPQCSVDGSATSHRSDALTVADALPQDRPEAILASAGSPGDGQTRRPVIVAHRSSVGGGEN